MRTNRTIGTTPHDLEHREIEKWSPSSTAGKRQSVELHESAYTVPGKNGPVSLFHYRDDITILNDVIHSDTLWAEPYTRS